MLNSLKLLVVNLMLFSISVQAQDTARWVAKINAFPDSALVYPVKLKLGSDNHTVSLSTYHNFSVSPAVNKVYVTKHNGNGNLLWTYVYDNNGANRVRAYDVVLDPQNGIYICGSILDSANNKSFVLKLNSDGKEVWKCDTFTGTYSQIFYRNQKIYVGSSGLSVLDSSGAILWSSQKGGEKMTVDSHGQILTVFRFSLDAANVNRYDSLGNKNLEIKNAPGNRIAVDAHNNIYILSDINRYHLKKFNSNGVFQWEKTDLPMAPPFGDIGFEILIDNNQDVILVGLSNSIFKFNSSGYLLWKRSMHGLDNSLIAAKMTQNNLLAIAGAASAGNKNQTVVATFNSEGKLNWMAAYNDTLSTQQFPVDLDLDHSNFYVLENNNQMSRLINFNPGFKSDVDYSLICVKEVIWSFLGTVSVGVFNGNLAHLNYPSLQIIAPNGDTVFNKRNQVDFFAQLGNTYQSYDDTSRIGVQDLSQHKFLLSQGFGDTTVEIFMCFKTELKNSLKQTSLFTLYPNPFSQTLHIDVPEQTPSQIQFSLMDALGRIIYQTNVFETTTLDLPPLNSGVYYYFLLTEAGEKQSGKLLKVD